MSADGVSASTTWNVLAEPKPWANLPMNFHPKCLSSRTNLAPILFSWLLPLCFLHPHSPLLLHSMLQGSNLAPFILLPQMVSLYSPISLLLTLLLSNPPPPWPLLVINAIFHIICSHSKSLSCFYALLFAKFWISRPMCPILHDSLYWTCRSANM